MDKNKKYLDRFEKDNRNKSLSPKNIKPITITKKIKL